MFGFITPNTCDDGHDNPCTGLNDAGTHAGGLVAIDAFLRHWMPLILNSPAYKDGSMLVAITTDESEPDANDPPTTSSCCYEQAGPNVAAPGDSSQPTNTAPGGGRVGMLLLDPNYIKGGTENTTGFYNHYSALRSYEDLLGLTTGGTDGLGHLGFAAAPGLVPFGPDVFNKLQNQ
jgi:hypothetical protein